MNHRNSSFGRRGAFTCSCCGRKTRETGVQSVDSTLCPDCWEIAGIYNVHQDGGDVKPYARDIRVYTANIVAKGGKLDSDAETLLELIGETVPGRAIVNGVQS